MSRKNYKDSELVNFCQLMITAEDYAERLQRMNGMRMGLTNRYKNSVDDVDKTTLGRRLVLWKKLVDAYK